MPGLPAISGTKVVRVFERAGWHVDRQPAFLTKSADSPSLVYSCAMRPPRAAVAVRSKER